MPNELPGPSLDTVLMAKAIELGRRRANELVDEVTAFAPPGPPKGLLIAEGDSWFDYPFHDVLKKLKSFDYRIETVAHRGDNVEDMAFEEEQEKGIKEMFDEVAADGKEPRAILLSGGGNDIAGTEFGVLLNHRRSELDNLSEKIVLGVLDERVLHAMVKLVSFVTTLSERCFQRKVPIVLHGYGRSVPDGRGFWGGAWILPGPWLEPGFRKKGYDNFQARIDLVGTLIDRFNELLAGIPNLPGLDHVRYLDVRPLLSNNAQQYKNSWENELHPTDAGFTAVAQAFDQVIQQFPMPPTP